MVIEEISAVEKYALKYYLPTIHQIVGLSILFYTRNVNLFTSYCFFMLMAGYYLPIQDNINTKYTKDQNKRKWALIPLIINSLSTPLILLLIWRAYDTLVQGMFINGFILVLGLSIIVATSMDGSHQLIHREQMYCRIAAYINFYCFHFTAYPIEHLYLHHKKVGTKEDPITASKNQNIYRYYVNAIVSAYKFNYGYNKTIFLGCVLATLSHTLLICGFAIKEGSGIGKIGFFIGFVYLSLFLLESIEYIQHYGLIYRTSNSTKPVTDICSWNTSKNIWVNYIVFKFQRHSDHHMNAYKLYNTLDLTQKMPQFPFDFSTATFISIFPPLWHWVANPLVDEIIEGKKVDQQHLKNIEFVFHGFRITFVFLFIANLGFI